MTRGHPCDQRRTFGQGWLQHFPTAPGVGVRGKWGHAALVTAAHKWRVVVSEALGPGWAITLCIRGVGQPLGSHLLKRSLLCHLKACGWMLWVLLVPERNSERARKQGWCPGAQRISASCEPAPRKAHLPKEAVPGGVLSEQREGPTLQW